MTSLKIGADALPLDWTVIPAGYLFRREKRTGMKREQLLSVYRDYGVVPKDSRNDNFNKPSEDLDAYQLVEPMDLVINKMKAWQGSLGISEHRGIVSPAYFVASPTREFSCRFVHYQLRCESYLVEYQTRSAGIRVNQWDLDWDDFQRIHVVLPPQAEQERIANFLDDKTARIDALIAEKERLLATLEEYRLSAINKAVSIGISTSARLQKTDDEWISQVPVHWSFCPLNYRYEVQLGKMLDEKRITGEFLRPYLRNTDVQWGRVNIETLPVMDIHPDELTRYTVQQGDLLVCEGGDVGRAAIWTASNGEIAYQKALHRVRPRSCSDMPRYLYYALFDSAKRGRFAGRGQATIAHLTAEAFRRYRFAFPPEDEQREIVRNLDEMSAKLDALVAHNSEHIARLREYRSSLISAAVTGQIDVGAYEVAA